MTPIRRATLEDVPALAGLTGQLGYPTTEAELRDRLAAMLATDWQAVFVAVDGTLAIGWIHVAVEHALASSTVATLHGLVVDESHRSRGVGRDLLGAAEAWARERKCAAVLVRSRVARERAHRFYEREGFELVKTSHVFTRSLV